MRSCSVTHGPRSPLWEERLVEEFESLLEYVQELKSRNADWFIVDPNDDGTVWTGKCWMYIDSHRAEYQLIVELPPTYPAAPPSIRIPALEGKTTKMYRGGSICIDEHFVPLWQRNMPAFGIAHALHHGLQPWLQVELPLQSFDVKSGEA